MIVLIIGYPGSGKSALAEQKAMELPRNDRRIYLATMIPYGEEGKMRVERHRKMRSGKGFDTIEAPFDVYDTMRNNADSIEQRSCTVLLECVSNLAANYMFERKAYPEETINIITEDIKKLAGTAGNLIIVTNHFDVQKDFDEETVMYAETMDRINEELAGISDEVIRLQK